MEFLMHLSGAGVLAVLAVILVLIVKQKKAGIPAGKNRPLLVLLSVAMLLLLCLYGFLDYRNSLMNRVVYKPVIYLYPEEETAVSVELGKPDLLTVSYPLYEEGWNVTAAPNGDLLDTKTGRGLYALYYESQSAVSFRVEEDGFVVRAEDTAAFLEEKLAILGLNHHEAEEFIIYWLPILQANSYNYVRFALPEEMEQNMPLTIHPAPDTLIRILMTWKGLDRPIEVAEQALTQVKREGYTVVEWGGTRIP